MVMGDGLGEHLKHLKQIHSVHWSRENRQVPNYVAALCLLVL